jgi:hypothetical protein
MESKGHHFLKDYSILYKFYAFKHIKGYAITKNDKDFIISWLTVEDWANNIYNYVLFF